MKDTLRLLLSLSCNLNCEYCCNRIPEVKKRFREMPFGDIDFSRYQNICLTGGEPFMDRLLLYAVIRAIPESKNIYLYTNGLLIMNVDVYFLGRIPNFKGLNIGLHYLEQLEQINGQVDRLNVRYAMRDTLAADFFAAYPGRMNKNNTKIWKMNECDTPNEDLVLLQI